MTCAGWPVAGACENEAGHPQLHMLPASKLYCLPCDQKRIAHVSETLRKAVQALRRRG